MQNILVTGSNGYIGSHTLIDLYENIEEANIFSLDNFLRSNENNITRIEKVVNKKINHFNIDLCDETALINFFEKNKIDSIIHFAALKAVGESVNMPIEYYKNNITGLLNLLHCVEKFEVKNFIFSSSCSVYGNTTEMPVTENTPLANSESPYAHTKKIGEEIIGHFSKISSCKFLCLRYFNPAGAHISGEIGEIPFGKNVLSLITAITSFANCKTKELNVFGNDYDTRDGSCIRDYIHVSDIAHAHFLGLKYLQNLKDKNIDYINLGLGQGVSVLEAIDAFEKHVNTKLNYTISPPRQGDVVAIYADNKKAKELLHWQPKFGIDDIIKTAWAWEIKSKD